MGFLSWVCTHARLCVRTRHHGEPPAGRHRARGLAWLLPILPRARARQANMPPLPPFAYGTACLLGGVEDANALVLAARPSYFLTPTWESQRPCYSYNYYSHCPLLHPSHNDLYQQGCWRGRTPLQPSSASLSCCPPPLCPGDDATGCTLAAMAMAGFGVSCCQVHGDQSPMHFLSSWRSSHGRTQPPLLQHTCAAGDNQGCISCAWAQGTHTHILTRVRVHHPHTRTHAHWAHHTHAHALGDTTRTRLPALSNPQPMCHPPGRGL